jgi:hypothetical protein
MNVKLTLADPSTRIDSSALSPSDIVSLNIYRATGDGAPVLVGTADPAGSPPVFEDENLTPGTYGYAVSATGKVGGEGPHSDLFPVVIAAAPAAPSAPTIVSAVVE